MPKRAQVTADNDDDYNRFSHAIFLISILLIGEQYFSLRLLLGQLVEEGSRITSTTATLTFIGVMLKAILAIIGIVSSGSFAIKDVYKVSRKVNIIASGVIITYTFFQIYLAFEWMRSY